MEKINLHKVDLPDVIKENFDWLNGKLHKSINKSKEMFRFLFYVYRDSSELLQMSVLEKPEVSQQKYWFTYGLNCISEFCRLAHFPNEVKEVQIDEDVFFPLKWKV